MYHKAVSNPEYRDDKFESESVVPHSAAHREAKAQRYEDIKVLTSALLYHSVGQNER